MFLPTPEYIIGLLEGYQEEIDMKKLLYMAVCAVMAVSLFGCAPQSSEPNNTQQAEENNEYLESIEDYFPTDNTYRSYHGYAEAGFEVVYYDFEQNDEMTVYKYMGAMNDERAAVEDAERSFVVTYTITGDRVVEHVENSDPIAESENNVYSKIEDMVVLSGEIKEGNSWTQEIELDGNKTEAVTEITEVTEDSFKTVTTAEAEGYKDGKYTEERVYTKGVGLASFSNTPYGSDKDDTLIFGYGFSVGNAESITGILN